MLADADDAKATIVATGSEVWVALAARDELDVPVRVVSMPSWELFEAQDDAYRESVLPSDLPTVSVEAGIRMGWERYADSIVSIDRFGASAPGNIVLEKLGMTPANVAEHVRRLLASEHAAPPLPHVGWTDGVGRRSASSRPSERPAAQRSRASGSSISSRILASSRAASAP